jgi:PTH1 family peptidyl-tRNA hydrolase
MRARSLFVQISQRSITAIRTTCYSQNYHKHPINMGKARQNRRAAARELDLEIEGLKKTITSQIDTRDPTISVARRSAARDNDSLCDNDDETLADSVESLILGDSAEQEQEQSRATPKSKKQKNKTVKATPTALPSPPSSPDMAVARCIPLLICSVGNPGSIYANTLHSAGHTVLKKLSERLEFQPYQKSRPHGSGLVSTGDSDWMLWQSTSLMNVSGKGVKAAHNTWSQAQPADSEGRLVIVHDELEKPLGAVNLNIRQGASAKGHNGLKSIMSSIGNVPFVRIGIGIGRPVSRDSKDVANYVMRKMTPGEKAKIEGSVEEVIAKLKELESG